MKLFLARPIVADGVIAALPQDELFSLMSADLSCYAYGMDSRQDARTRRPPIRFPFPLGKGLGVRFSVHHYAAKTISDGTKLPLVAEPSPNPNIWYETRFFPNLPERFNRSQP
jgi:hypothetical protein